MAAGDPSNVVALLTAFGLGSVVTALVQAWIARRSKFDERRFNEKQKAYVGLLEAYHRAAVERTEEAAKNFAYWQMRCELVGPQCVRDAVSDIVATNDDVSSRYRAHEALKDAIRSDLGITR